MPEKVAGLIEFLQANGWFYQYLEAKFLGNDKADHSSNWKFGISNEQLPKKVVDLIEFFYKQMKDFGNIWTPSCLAMIKQMILVIEKFLVGSLS